MMAAAFKRHFSQKHRSSSGFIGYFDSFFVDWTSRLMHRGILDYDHWLIRCPKYLRGCCPRIRALDEDQVLLEQLEYFAPVHAFAYVLTRRLAELTVQLVACWIIACCIAVLAVSIWKTWKVSYRQKRYGRNTTKIILGWWNLKNVGMLLSLAPLSIFLPLLAEMTIGGVFNYQLDMLSTSSKLPPSYILMPWKIEYLRNQNEPPSLLDLLNFFQLRRSLFGGASHIVVRTSTALDNLRLQTTLSLLNLSVLVFIGTVYGVVTLSFHTVVWRPIKRLFSKLASEDFDRLRALKENRQRSSRRAERDEIFEKCDKKVLDPGDKRSSSALDFSTTLEEKRIPSRTKDNLVEHFDKYIYPDPEFLLTERGDSRLSVAMSSRKNKEPSRNRRPDSGDGPEVGISRPRWKSQRLSEKIVSPRYVSRGTYACLDSFSSDDEYAFSD